MGSSSRILINDKIKCIYMKKIFGKVLVSIIVFSTFGLGCFASPQFIKKKKKNEQPTGAILVYLSTPHKYVDVFAVYDKDTLLFKDIDTEPIDGKKPFARCLMPAPVGNCEVIVRCQGYKSVSDSAFVEPGFLTTLNISITEKE